MDQLFPLPIYTFTRMVVRNGGISRKGLRNLPAWLIKLILFEPLRWADLTFTGRVRRHIIREDPLFILGYYRNGTSFLHQFLTQDDRFGYHTNFQMILPDLMLSGERWLAPFFDAMCGWFDLRDPVHRIQMSFRFPGEEDGAMTTSVNPRGAAWGWFFPTMMIEHYHKYCLFEGIPDSERAGWRADFLFLLKKISLANHGRRLVLKSPPHTARIKLLLSLFPRARFIFLHRNPYDVFASNRRFWAVTNRIYALGPTRSVNVDEIILDTYAAVMDRYLAERDLIPDGHLIELPYRELIRHPLSAMRRLYEELHLGDFQYCEPAMTAYIARQKKYVRLNHQLSPSEKALVAGRWAPFFRQWHYPLA